MDWLKCNICFNTYNESSLRPRNLNCGHTFCEKCLNNTFQNKSLTCPQCRNIHGINSVLELPINFIVEGLLKSLNICSQDESEGAVSNPIEGESDADDISETHGSLKSLLEQQEKSLSSQKELLKTSAGMCNEHPGNEWIFRCSLHMCWVCEMCIEEEGNHYKHKCKISSFKEEIEDRRQEHKKSLEDEGKSCDESLTIIERHISSIRNERENHISLINSLQELLSIHKREEENLQSYITAFQKNIEKGKNVKQRLLDTNEIVLNASTLDESNVARDMVKKKKVESRDWVNTSQREVDQSKLEMENSTLLSMLTKKSLEYREKTKKQIELEKNKGKITKSSNQIKLRDIEFTRKNLNKIAHLYEEELNEFARSKKKPWNFWDNVIKVQLVLLGLLTKISDEVNESTSSTTWAVKASQKDCSVLAGKLISSNGRLLLHSMQSYDNLPRNAITLPFDDIMSLIPSSPEVFLKMSHNGINFGQLEICLDGNAYPRRIQQFVDLTTGSSEQGCYRTSSFTVVANKGLPAETVLCAGHMTSIILDEALYDLESCEGSSVFTEGAITQYNKQHSKFGICTKSEPNSRKNAIILGHVTSGLELLKKVVEIYSYKTVQSVDHNLHIIFSECGLIIDSTK